MKKSILFLLAVIIIVGMISCSGNKNQDDKYRQGWTLVWDDNFDGAVLNTSIWSKLPQGEGFNDRYMSNDDAVFRFHEENIVLLGLKNPVENADQPFITGGISTVSNKSLAKVSRIEARLRTVGKPGAIYYMSLLPTKQTEANQNVFINIMARYEDDAFIYNQVSSDYTQAIKDNPPALTMIGINPDHYHTFAMESYPDSLVFFVNDIRTKMYPRFPTVEGQFPFSDETFNLVFGVSMRGNTQPDDLPMYMFIDWVRYYECNNP